jgi:hypothetical protein
MRMGAWRARDLPETTPHSASPRLTRRGVAGPPTCAVAWAREVLHGVVNRPRIDGKDGVAGSIPAGGSTTNQQLRPGPRGVVGFEVDPRCLLAAVDRGDAASIAGWFELGHGPSDRSWRSPDCHSSCMSAKIAPSNAVIVSHATSLLSW